MSTVIFAANNDSYRRRRRAHRACDQCKRRRTRCEPSLMNSDNCAVCARYGIECSLSTPATTVIEANPSHFPPSPFLLSLSSEQSAPTSRFVGDLNPEALFLTTATNSPLQQHRDKYECGVWTSPQRGVAPSNRVGYPSVAIICPGSSPAYLTYLNSLKAFEFPQPHAQSALIDLYLSTVQPLFPILDTVSFLARPSASSPLLHAVLLVAARHPSATPYLTPPNTSPRDFAASTATIINALLPLEHDRLTLARIHALLALHSEGPNGNESASLHVATAVHHAYSIGIHIQSRVNRNHTEMRLWWCLWSLDALQACICGRPVGVRRDDVSVGFPRAEHVPAPFLAWLSIAQVLTNVIALYRPGSVAREVNWPTFDQVIGNADSSESGFTDPTISNSLKLFYHSVAILLSHRSSPTNFEEHEKSYTRRLTSANAILSLFSTEESFEYLAPLPIVPYSASLALTAFYSLLRAGESEFRPHALRTCEVLDALGRRWWFAGAMAGMGRSAIEGLRVREAAGVLTGLRDGEDNSNCVVDGGGSGCPPPSSAPGLDSFGGGGGNGSGSWHGGSANNGGYGSAVFEEDGFDAWFLQLFPDLAAPTGSFGL